mmetsp:Transcript_65401/g.171320  ORF Transcript_65401/g.171320 Transcript_65401/m.171320 type:complete len:638 (-) Transcript_65401:368-2281(-)
MQQMNRKMMTADESITKFASVRNNAATSDPSFGDWLSKEEQAQRGSKYGIDIVPAMIEVTRGSPNKYEIEKETGQLMLDRVLHSSVYYPGDYGYVPQTLCGDGDPLDILIVAPAESGTYAGLDTGVLANCRIVGLMDMEDESGHDEKMIAVLENQRSTDHITQLEHVPAHLRREIQHFFENYKLLETKKGKPKWAKVLGWGDKTRALEVVAESRRMWEEKQGKMKGPKFHPFVKVPKCPSLIHVKQDMDHADTSGVTCYVNVSKGCMNSYVYRQDTTYRHYKYTLDMPYPGDYGWICQTWQSDIRRPMEILMINTFGLAPECTTDVRIIGCMERSYRTPKKDGGVSEPVTDFKVIGVGANDPRMDTVKTLSNLNPQCLVHYTNFFTHTAEMANCTDCKIARFMEAEEAVQMVVAAHKQYNAAFKDKTLHNSANLWCLPWNGDASKGEACDRVYPAVVEASKHSSNIYNFDCVNGVLKHVSPLKTSTFWPGNYGFIPQTVAEDGKPVDVMILSNVPLRSGSVAEIRIVGAAECSDEMGPDIKMIAVPMTEPRMKEWRSIEDVPKHMRDEIVHFTNAYKDLEEDWKFCRFERWMDVEEATKYVQQSHSRFFLFTLPMQRLERRLSQLEVENSQLRSHRQ